MDSQKENTEKPQLEGPVVVACVVLQPRDAEHLLAVFQEAAIALAAHASAGLPGLPNVPTGEAPEDPWLKHSAAANYLGISTSTLYKYACQQRIECRKLGGRLDYRRSILDRFKEEQIRRVRPPSGFRSIIASAHGSGK